MTHHLATRLLAVLLPAALLLVPSPAHSEKIVTHDAVGDAVVVGWLADDEAELPPTPDPSPADIVRTIAAHGERRLAVAVHFRDLTGGRERSMRVLVRTPSGSFHLEVRTKGRRTRTTLDRRGEPLGCRGLRARVDVGADVVAVSVPTACLASPRWVRLGVTAFAPLRTTDPAVLASAVDDGHRDTVRLTSVGTGPRIRRG